MNVFRAIKVALFILFAGCAVSSVSPESIAPWTYASPTADANYSESYMLQENGLVCFVGIRTGNRGLTLFGSYTKDGTENYSRVDVLKGELEATQISGYDVFTRDCLPMIDKLPLSVRKTVSSSLAARRG